ncbi:MAG: hypothetical protein RSA26_05170, partial [Mucinivorans sp.]
MGDFFKSHDSARRLHGDFFAAPLAPSGLLLFGIERLHAQRFALAVQLGSSAVAHISMPKIAFNRQRGF